MALTHKSINIREEVWRQLRINAELTGVPVRDYLTFIILNSKPVDEQDEKAQRAAGFDEQSKSECTHRCVLSPTTNRGRIATDGIIAISAADFITPESIDKATNSIVPDSALLSGSYNVEVQSQSGHQQSQSATANTPIRKDKGPTFRCSQLFCLRGNVAG